MKNGLLTGAAKDLIVRHIENKDYGVQLVNLPDFDFVELVELLPIEQSLEIYFLGFSREVENMLIARLPKISGVVYSFSVEEAEDSRNSGNEDNFRILFIKRTELEKVSSLRWFPQITLTMLYDRACELFLESLANKNAVITELIKALRTKTVQKILSFERVIEYLELLLKADDNELPTAVVNNYHKLGLLCDSSLFQEGAKRKHFVAEIKENHKVVEKISNLEKDERNKLNKQYSKGNANKKTVDGILSYYQSREIKILGEMELDEVNKCLSDVKKSAKPTKKEKSKPVVNHTELAAKLIFEEDISSVEETLVKMAEKIDNRSKVGKKDTISTEVNGSKLQIKVEPRTESIAEALIAEDIFGGVIYAEAPSLEDVLDELGKYKYEPLSKNELDKAKDKLGKIGELLTDGEKITAALDNLLQARSVVAKYKMRLQDMPMLQVLARYEDFAKYIAAYNALLQTINTEFYRLCKEAAPTAKAIVNTIVEMDYIFVVGENSVHAIPTPLNPLYLWKYVELARDILDSRSLSGDEAELTANDREFIIRKAEDIPDPLSVMLMPETVTHVATLLPLVGRVGILPLYSSVPQINKSDSGLKDIEQAIIRYICLYPHAALRLRLCFIDPPAIEQVAKLLCNLERNSDISIEGIDLSIYRTRATSQEWAELSADMLPDGFSALGHGEHALDFSIRFDNAAHEYSEILSKVNGEQHLLIVFDPNEVKLASTENNRQIHIHPLCVPKLYQYDPLEEEVAIRPANEGGIFSEYALIIERINEQHVSFKHTGSFFRTPLEQATYKKMLAQADWLIILDQSLRNWDIALSTTSEKLFYRESDYRSMGIYSANCKKFIHGYDILAKNIGNFIPREQGLQKIIDEVRAVNNDGLLSIISHSSNKIFDEKHGKGSLGLAIAANYYRQRNPDTLLVGLDTQLAQEWLSYREQGELPDLVGITLEIDTTRAVIDVIEVKTHSNDEGSFITKENNGKRSIKGHAVTQVDTLETLIREMLGSVERITTVARREILREQVFDTLFTSKLDKVVKRDYCNALNDLFAGKYSLELHKNIVFVDFEGPDSSTVKYMGGMNLATEYTLVTIGSKDIQALLIGEQVTTTVVDKEVVDTEVKNVEAEENITDEGDSPTEMTADNLGQQLEMIGEWCIRLNKVLRDYDIKAEPLVPEQVLLAARFMRFKIQLKSGETISRINKYKRDIAIQLEASGDILVDHIRGTSYIALDVPIASVNSSVSLLDNIAELDGYRGRGLMVLAGQKPDGKIELVDIAKAPHMLIAGTTGSGKTIFLQSIIVSLLSQYSANELELLIIDPKQTDFIYFEGLPHLYGGRVVTDADEALGKLQQLNTKDKEERTQALRSCKSRDIDSYNAKNPNNRMKRLVVIIDEYSDLIQAAEINGTRKEFEKNLLLLLQRVRSLGIHLVIATQRPSAQIITGALKANVPFRVSFKLPSHTDSQTILDTTGAENLLGKGDMLMRTESDQIRMQGLFIAEDELDEFVTSIIHRDEH